MASYCLSLFFIAIMAAIALMTVTKARAQLSSGPVSSLLGLFRVDGVLYCTSDGNASGTSVSPPFPNATVLLQCEGAVISSTATDSSGLFSMMLDPLQVLLSNLLSNCYLTVATPLSTCNHRLPTTGILSSTLQSSGTSIVGLLTVTRLVPTGFRLITSN
ncbi:hypothetical protein SAY87_023743 [Trapa incisa]|uniref:Phylloplanin n=1 Tax=Trapa incisa TaxID=236973 RepID=A0AAN7KYA4_9MYRT|nr:hypothetical protein SAY87_023743 [Trapa incisa]